MRRDDLRLTEDGGEALLERMEGDREAFGLTMAELRWVVFAAGPAVLDKHDPLPGPSSPDQTGRVPLPPFEPPEIHPGQLEIG